MPPVPATSPTVAKDIEADARGEARDESPTPPPPGTIEATFWQNPAVLTALASTLAFGLFVARPHVIRYIGEAAEALFEIAAWGWAAAFGVHKAGDTLRYK